MLWLGFEPGTIGVGGKRSTTELRPLAIPVGLDVSGECPFECEGLAALATHVVSLACVGQHVVLESAGLGESLVADWTIVVPRASVNNFVPRQIVARFKRLPTLLTPANRDKTQT